MGMPLRMGHGLAALSVAARPPCQMDTSSLQSRRPRLLSGLPAWLTRMTMAAGIVPVALSLALAACSGETGPPTPEPTATPETFPPRDLTVLVGAGERTAAINAFFPSASGYGQATPLPGR